MPTLITKTFGAGRDLTTNAAVRTYLGGLDLVALDQVVDIIYHDDMFAQFMEVQSSDETRRVRFKPALDRNPNVLGTSTLNVGGAGAKITWNRGNEDWLGAGIDIYDMNLEVVGGGTSYGFYTKGNSSAPNDNQFFRCRLHDASAGTGPTMIVGNGGGTTRFVDCLAVVEGAANKQLFSVQGYIKTEGCMLVARGAAVGGTTKAIDASLNGSSASNSAFIGFGSTIIDTFVATTNCFSNTTPSGGNTSLTVVTAAGGLVINEASDYLLSATSAMIGAASSAADNTTDMFGGFRGDNPDAGPVMRVAAAVTAAPNATVTNIEVIGQKVIVSGTSSAVIGSGTATLPAAVPANGAVTKAGTFSFVGLNWTATFTNGNPGDYALPQVILTNTGGTGTCSGGTPTTIAVPVAPVIAITSQSKTTNSITVSGTVTNYPTSGVLTITGPTNATPALTITDGGTFTATATGLASGSYTVGVSATNFTGTGSATGNPMSVYAAGTQPVGLAAVDLSPYSAPAFNAPTVADNGTIATLTLQNTTGSIATNQPFAIGHAFKKGQLKPSDSLVGKIAGQADLVLQFDVKATHTDGSIRHGLIAGILPTIAANAEVVVNLTRSTAARDNTPLSPATVAASGANVVFTAVIGGTTYTADLDAALTAGVGLITHRAGPVVTEYVVDVPLKNGATPHATLVAQFAIKHFGSIGASKVDVTVENGLAYVAGSDVTYNATISVGGVNVYTKTALAHFWACRWKKSFWHGVTPALHEKFDIGYLLDTKLVPNYDRTLPKMPDASIQQYYVTDLALNDVEPMGEGRYFKEMGSPGGRHDIGIAPRWHADWILTQDKRVKDFALLHGDVAGAWDVHLRNNTTDSPGKGHPLNVVYFPYTTRLGTAGDSFNPATGQQEKLPDVASARTTQADVAHQAGFAYVPYLLTGDYYYLEELMFWSSYCAWVQNPYYRGYVRGLVSPDQLRGQGWALRSMCEAAAILPDAHPEKANYQHLIESNLEWYNEQYTDNPSANGIGVIVNGDAPAYGDGSPNNATAPWQDDFFTMSVGHAAELGFTKANRLLNWKAKFQLGRMIGTDWCYMHAARYQIRVRDTAQSPYYADLNECWAKIMTPEMKAAACASQAMADLITADNAANNQPYTVTPGEIVGNAQFTLGFPSNYQPALAMVVDMADPAMYPNADDAWTVFANRAVQPDYSLDGAQFAIVPRNEVDEEPGGGEEPVPTVTSVTVSPATAAIAGGATQQFTRTVNGTNSPSQAGTWSANIGSVNSSGLYTAPASTGSAQTATVTFTSAQDATKAGSATVTIPAVVANTRAVTVTLGDTGGASAGLTNLSVAVHAEIAPHLFTVPIYQSGTGTTNGAGVLSFTFNSNLAAGTTVHLTVLAANLAHFNGRVVLA